LELYLVGNGKEMCLNSWIPDLLKHQQTNEVMLEILRFPRRFLLINICLSRPFEQSGKFQDGGSKFFRDIENKQNTCCKKEKEVSYAY